MKLILAIGEAVGLAFGMATTRRSPEWSCSSQSCLPARSATSTETRERGLLMYLALWAIVFPIQTVVVFSDGGSDVLSWVFNALILCLGIGLQPAGLGAREAQARRHRRNRGGLT
jgi:hypothetical protein